MSRMIVENWSHHAEYILTLMGFGVGVGTIWKFPYMVARNGGGSFLIPYFIFVMIGSVPITYIEMFIGQYSRGGPIGAWDLCPSLKGIGIGAAMISGIFSIYYPVFFSWILYYLFFSFFPVLPWTRCGQSWNSPDCVDTLGASDESLPSNVTTLSNTSLGYSDVSMPPTLLHVNSTSSSHDNNSHNSGVPSAEEFFRNNVLQITDGLENMGTLRWPLVLTLGLTFLSVYICIIKGIRLSGKIVYVTVICPYILVTVILIRACTLPGSINGILFYITPNFEKLMDFQVWLEACGFALYAMGVTYGVIITMAAHNPLTNNCLRDAVVINIVCALSQVYFGFSVFGITGHLAHKRGVDFDFYRTSGFKLGFITYPEATAYLPIPQLWSVLLFVMLFTLGIDSLIPCSEVVAHMFGYWFPALAKRRWLLNAIVLIPSFLLSIPFACQGGVYLLTLVEWFAFFPSLLLFAIMECVAVGWVYGIPQVNQAMVIMKGSKMNKVMEILWKFICPLLLMVLLCYSFYSYRPPQFEEYVYPDWANVIGWFISAICVLPLPVYFLWSIWKAPGETIREKMSAACKPRLRWNIEETMLKQKIELQGPEEPFL